MMGYTLLHPFFYASWIPARRWRGVRNGEGRVNVPRHKTKARPWS